MQIDQSCYPTPESSPWFVRLPRLQHALHLVARVAPSPEGNALRSLQRGMCVLPREMNVGCDADGCVCAMVRVLRGDGRMRVWRYMQLKEDVLELLLESANRMGRPLRMSYQS